MFKKILAVSMFLMASVISSKAQQWASSVSPTGDCVYDRNGNVISCQPTSQCKYVSTGITRTGTFFVCDAYWPWWFGGGCIYGHNETYTENQYRTECPLDNNILLLILPLGFLGLFFLRKHQFSSAL